MTEAKAEGVGTDLVKRGMAQILKGGVTIDVVTAEQAKIVEGTGAVAVMTLERVPADVRAEGGVAHMSNPDLIGSIINAVSIPVMTKARIGYFAGAQVLQSLGMDYTDESEVLTPADHENHIDKWDFTVLFVCGATNLGGALRHIGESAVMIRFKGGTGASNVSNAMTYMRTITSEINRLALMRPNEAFHAAKELQVLYPLMKEVAETGKLPVVLFTAGGIATPAGATLVMQLGAGGVFVGSRIFKSGNPAKRAAAIIKTAARSSEPELVAKVSRSLDEAMVGISAHDLPAVRHLEDRGWQAQINLKDTDAALLRTWRSRPVNMIHKEGC